jgi:competence protein ComEC
MRKCLLILVPFLLFTGQFIVTNFSPNGEITILDVGQGDCIYIRLPFGKGDYLIDTGGRMEFEQEMWQMRDHLYEVGEDTVVPFLKSKGVTTIDKLIITHGDMDHAGGAEAVLRELKVHELVIADRKNKTRLETKLIEKARDQNISLQFVHAGDSWRIDDHLFSILSPEENSNSESNDGSIVVYTELGGLKWLFTGDLETEGEAKLIEQYPSLSVDILKVGHHGSISSTGEAFLKQLSPQIAIISVGQNNRYRHPHQEILDRLEKQKIKIFRTDEEILNAIRYHNSFHLHSYY